MVYYCLVPQSNRLFPEKKGFLSCYNFDRIVRYYIVRIHSNRSRSTTRGPRWHYNFIIFTILILITISHIWQISRKIFSWKFPIGFTRLIRYIRLSVVLLLFCTQQISTICKQIINQQEFVRFTNKVLSALSYDFVYRRCLDISMIVNYTTICICDKYQQTKIIINIFSCMITNRPEVRNIDFVMIVIFYFFFFLISIQDVTYFSFPITGVFFIYSVYGIK